MNIMHNDKQKEKNDHMHEFSCECRETGAYDWYAYSVNKISNWSSEIFLLLRGNWLLFWNKSFLTDSLKSALTTLWAVKSMARENAYSSGFTMPMNEAL